MYVFLKFIQKMFAIVLQHVKSYWIDLNVNKVNIVQLEVKLSSQLLQYSLERDQVIIAQYG